LTLPADAPSDRKATILRGSVCALVTVVALTTASGKNVPVATFRTVNWPTCPWLIEPSTSSMSLAPLAFWLVAGPVSTWSPPVGCTSATAADEPKMTAPTVPTGESGSAASALSACDASTSHCRTSRAVPSQLAAVLPDTSTT
jgi:hypothetical protein